MVIEPEVILQSSASFGTSHLFIASTTVHLPNRPKNNDTIALIFVENIGYLFS